MNVGRVIKTLRDNAGLSQGKLAEKSNITQAYLSQIENGKRDPHMPSLKKLCEVLDFPLPILLFMSVDESDIPEDRREVFKALFPSVRDFLVHLFPKSATMIEQ